MPVASLQLEDREIGALVLEHDIAIELAPVGERDLHLVGVGDDVEVGHDDPRRIDDDAGAERPLDALLGWPTSPRSPKKRRKNGSEKNGDADCSTTREA